MLVIVSAFVGLGFFGIVQAKKPRTIANGSWGGQHIQMSVTNGSASIEYDCANGTITGPLKIDSRGRFELRGTHNVEHGGPVRMDNKGGEGEPAKYTGWTDGKKMKLSVRLVNSKTDIGTFDLTRGNAGRIFKCR
jgi:hypothetical protein